MNTTNNYKEENGKYYRQYFTIESGIRMYSSYFWKEISQREYKLRYKINFHAHTHYSDGGNTIKEMAQAYKNEGFSCAVISDHYYARDDLERYSMTKRKFLKAIIDAEEVEKELDFPVIIGVEYCFFHCEEVLCFGRDFIMSLYDEVKSVQDFEFAKNYHKGAAILCHPRLCGGDGGFINIGGADVIDGYEHCNSGSDYFQKSYKRRMPEEFKDLIGYSNADAHGIGELKQGYNIVDEDIKSEKQLVNFIRARKSVDRYIYGVKHEREDKV